MLEAYPDRSGRYILVSLGVTMGLIRDEDAVEIRERLQQMGNPVKLVHFTQELNLELGAETLQLVKELAGLSDKLSLEVFNLDRKSTRLNSSHIEPSRMPSSA